jgi:hypothetical protein
MRLLNSSLCKLGTWAAAELGKQYKTDHRHLLQ